MGVKNKNGSYFSVEFLQKQAIANRRVDHFSHFSFSSKFMIDKWS